MNLTQYFKDKETKILLLSAAVYIGLIYFYQKTLDIQSVLVYLILAVIITKVFKLKKPNMYSYLLLGAGLSIGYHLIFQILGVFTVPTGLMIQAAIEQGLLVLTIAFLWGSKK